MKKLILSILLVGSVLGANAQNRKHIANFSLFQQYYNPALTGYEGTMLKTFHRNQWSGFEGAPKTFFASAELDLADLSAWKRSDLSKTKRHDFYDRQAGAKHAFGLAVLQDQFGPFSESQVHLSYASRIRLSERLSLRWGGAATYSAQRLDGNKLTIDNENDPEYQDVMGQRVRQGKLDLNLGWMLTEENFYLGYAMQDITKTGIVASGDEFLQDLYTRKHFVQAGYRTAVSDQIGIVANAMLQYDDQLKEGAEVQLKAVYQNMFWLGGGYRKDLAYNATAGIRFEQFRIGYAYEMPTADAKYISRGTNEISLTYNLIPVKYPKYGKQVTIW
ncbi:PorP/SprF family type IX secretion system membrane protein [Pontibacter sp. JH31]|uniref:PorP/SprF family type IX secretion system membrane protein n=1 Tax=Pontibacter aquaedesilientis TaxID=2766980 RepID=A0ABR7XKR4_9BACT|nr:PorP/SprF family type IX secretion system membrane protein [Pontibacter aquaedesilientis]MBD1398870.1 PorP/SprF family type IX secretion system membrane protein [Pontibacter aquaedesilientis]